MGKQRRSGHGGRATPASGGAGGGPTLHGDVGNAARAERIGGARAAGGGRRDAYGAWMAASLGAEVPSAAAGGARAPTAAPRSAPVAPTSSGLPPHLEIPEAPRVRGPHTIEGFVDSGFRAPAPPSPMRPTGQGRAPAAAAAAPDFELAPLMTYPPSPRGPVRTPEGFVDLTGFRAPAPPSSGMSPPEISLTPAPQPVRPPRTLAPPPSPEFNAVPVGLGMFGLAQSLYGLGSSFWPRDRHAPPLTAEETESRSLDRASNGLGLLGGAAGLGEQGAAYRAQRLGQVGVAAPRATSAMRFFRHAGNALGVLGSGLDIYGGQREYRAAARETDVDRRDVRHMDGALQTGRGVVGLLGSVLSVAGVSAGAGIGAAVAGAGLGHALGSSARDSADAYARESGLFGTRARDGRGPVAAGRGAGAPLSSENRSAQDAAVDVGYGMDRRLRAWGVNEDVAMAAGGVAAGVTAVGTTAEALAVRGAERSERQPRRWW